MIIKIIIFIVYYLVLEQMEARWQSMLKIFILTSTIKSQQEPRKTVIKYIFKINSHILGLNRNLSILSDYSLHKSLLKALYKPETIRFLH